MPMVDHAILSLYDTVPEQNSISRMLIEDMVIEYDASEFIGSAIPSVVSLDDLRAIAHAMLFPSVDNLAQITKIQEIAPSSELSTTFYDERAKALWLVDNDPLIIVVISNGASVGFP
ncbi:uncharacterized protein ARMOST_06641 [Armillaria ostoyae]|uniref:Uncharacterized protein n=1 Tax=Armillaria ostoyae TaxID=47428 RepID=A0A284R3L5_ARMOS|nr:uncharacterized protein ARMOST_06641 [Armillaria ostoyae]